MFCCYWSWRTFLLLSVFLAAVFVVVSCSVLKRHLPYLRPTIHCDPVTHADTLVFAVHGLFGSPVGVDTLFYALSVNDTKWIGIAPQYNFALMHPFESLELQTDRLGQVLEGWIKQSMETHPSIKTIVLNGVSMG